MKKILEVKHLKVSPINEPRKILVDDVSFDLYFRKAMINYEN